MIERILPNGYVGEGKGAPEFGVKEKSGKVEEKPDVHKKDNENQLEIRHGVTPRGITPRVLLMLALLA